MKITMMTQKSMIEILNKSEDEVLHPVNLNKSGFDQVYSVYNVFTLVPSK